MNTVNNQTKHPKQRGSTLVWILVWLVGVISIAWASLNYALPRFEQKLQSAVAESISAFNGTDVRVVANGRNITLSGNVNSEQQRYSLQTAANDAIGVGNVRNEIIIVEASSKTDALSPKILPIDVDQIENPLPEEPSVTISAAVSEQQTNNTESIAAVQIPDSNETVEKPLEVIHLAANTAAKDPVPSKQQPTINIRVFGNILSIEGTMATSDDISGLVRSAVSSFDRDVVSNGLTLQDDIESASWLLSLRKIMPMMKPMSNAEISIANQQIILSGIAPDRQAHDEIISQTLSLMSTYSLVEKISVSGGEEEAPVVLTADANSQNSAEAEAAAKAEEEALELARLKAEATAKAEEQARIKAKAEEMARLEAEATAKARAEQLARIEAEAAAKAKADEIARAEAEEKAKALELARIQAEAAEKAKAEEQARLLAAAKAKADEQAKLEAEKQARLIAEARQKALAEEEAKQQAENAAAEEQARIVREAIAAAKAKARIRRAQEAAAAKERADQIARERVEAAAKARADQRARLLAEAEAKARADDLARRRTEAAEKARAVEVAKRQAREAEAARIKAAENEAIFQRPTQQSKLQDEISNLASLRILFETHKNTLTLESLDILDEIAAVVLKYPESQIIIEGHTDATGDPDQNLQLSLLRATTVRDYLISRGVSTFNLRAIGLGEGAPLVSNNTPEGRAINRRIEFKFQ